MWFKKKEGGASALLSAIQKYQKQIMTFTDDLTAAVSDFLAAQTDNTAAIEKALAILQADATNQGIGTLVETQVTAIKAATAAMRSETAKLQTILTPAPTPTPAPAPATPPSSNPA